MSKERCDKTRARSPQKPREPKPRWNTRVPGSNLDAGFLEQTLGVTIFLGFPPACSVAKAQQPDQISAMTIPCW